MSDYLYNVACNFEKAIKNSYELTVGNGKKQITLLIPSVDNSEFTHIMGLDHLSDIKVLNAQNSTQKSAVFKKILSKQITFEDISYSQYLNSPIVGSHNYRSNSEYTVNDRIKYLSNFEDIMDNFYKGKVYKWNLSKCRIKLPNGNFRKTTINADYLITVPSNESNETVYLFAYQTNKHRSKSEPILLNIFSAFPDGIDLTSGQDKPYTILKEKKNNVSIYTHPSYKKELEQHTVQSQPQQNDNIKQIKFDSPAPQNIVHSGSGAAAAVMPKPDPLKNIFEKIMSSIKNFFKMQDKQSTVPVQSDTQSEIIEEEFKVEENLLPPKFAKLIEARELFAENKITFNEYQQALKSYLYSLKGKEMWAEAADTLRNQLKECPDNLKKPINYEINIIERNFEKRFAPKPPEPEHKQTFDEIKRAAHEKYVKMQNEKTKSEKEEVTVNNFRER